MGRTRKQPKGLAPPHILAHLLAQALSTITVSCPSSFHYILHLHYSELQQDGTFAISNIQSQQSLDQNTFSMILEKAQVVTIPGAGFGPGGEGFLRLSAFAPREAVIEACSRLKEALA